MQSSSSSTPSIDDFETAVLNRLKREQKRRKTLKEDMTNDEKLIDGRCDSVDDP